MILDRLDRLDGLAPAEAQLASFVAAHPREVVDLTIGELAGRTATSNATIIRFCRRLGLAGFRAFRIQLAAEIERSHGAAPIDADYPFAPAEPASTVIDRIAALTHEAVDSCRAVLEPAQIMRIAQLIKRSATVQLYAIGDSQITVEGFANLLLKLGINCVIAGRQGEYRASAFSARRGDIAIIASYAGRFIELPSMAGVLPALHERGCATVLLTAGDISSLWIDHVIRFPHRESARGKMATFYSQTCLRFILNCLYAEVFSLDYAGSDAHKSSFDAADAPRSGMVEL